jgi:hypothetical protein
MLESLKAIQVVLDNNDRMIAMLRVRREREQQEREAKYTEIYKNRGN